MAVSPVGNAAICNRARSKQNNSMQSIARVAPVCSASWSLISSNSSTVHEMMAVMMTATYTGT